MKQPKLVLLNGFAGCGKSTIANKYIEDHPLSMNLEGDRLIVMLGKWKENWDNAARIKIALSKVIAAEHLKSGYDVVVPFLLTDPQDAEEFQRIAENVRAKFLEVMLTVEKRDAIDRLLKRGRWGEEGSSTFTNEELPRIISLYDRMESATAKRTNTVHIHPQDGDIEGTYKEFLQVVE